MPNKSYQFAISAKNNTKQAFSAINKDLDKSSINIEEMKTKMRSLASSASTGLVSGAAAAGAGLLAMTVHAADAAREIQSLSDIAGINTESFQKMSFGAKQFGIDQDKLSDTLKDVNDKIGDFMQTGAGPMADFFESIAPKVGVTAAEFKNLNSADALQLYVSSLEKANVSQAEMTFYMEAIASDSTALLPLFEKNGEALRAQADEAERLGLVLSDTDTAMLDMADKQMDMVKDSFSSFTNQVAVEFSPILIELSNQFLNSAKEAGGFGEIATRVFDSVMQAAGLLGNAVRGIEIIWQGLKLVGAGVLEETLSLIAMVETGWRELINLIPGVSLETESAVDKIRDSISHVRKTIEQDLHGTLMEPLPSESITIWAEDVKSKAQEAAAAVAAAKSGNVVDSLTGEAGGGGVEQDPEVIAAQERMQYLQELREIELITEEEAEEMAHLRRMEMLEKRYGEQAALKDQYNVLKEKLEVKHEKKMSKLSQKKAKEDMNWEKMNAQNRLGVISDFAGAAGQHSEGLLKVSQVSGAGQALIATITGQAESLKLGFPMGLIAAAKIGLAGFGFVKTIKGISTSVKSASPAGGVPSVGASPSLGNANLPSQIQPIESEGDDLSRSQRVTNVTIKIDPDEQYSGRKIRDLMESMAEQTSELNVSF